MEGTIVGIVTKMKKDGVVTHTVVKKAVGVWECDCAIGKAKFPCPHKRAVWAGRSGNGVKIIERRALKRGWMPSA